MKKILILDSDNSGLDPTRRVIIKKNKTIIKDRDLYDNKDFLQTMRDKDIPYSFYLEEWEVLDSSTGRIQLICANDGSPLRPVHIISETRPNNGVKALFQSEKMIIFKIQNGSFEICKYYIDENGNIISNVLTVGEYNSFNDIKNKVDKNFSSVIESLDRNYNNFIDSGYLSPIWSIL